MAQSHIVLSTLTACRQAESIALKGELSTPSASYLQLQVLMGGCG